MKEGKQTSFPRLAGKKFVGRLVEVKFFEGGVKEQLDDKSAYKTVMIPAFPFVQRLWN